MHFGNGDKPSWLVAVGHMMTRMCRRHLPNDGP